MNFFVRNPGIYEPLIKEVLTETEAVWGEGGITVTLAECDEGVRVVSDGENVTLYYSDLTSLFRGLGTAVVREGTYDVTEKLRYRQLGNMIDCSRNAVARVETVKRFCRISALMGFNIIQLYTEDTYEIEDEPYFGHLRGRYTSEELREIDEYASQLGIEVIPCIQTLAHLNAIFRWKEYQPVCDIDNILNVGLERTYELIEKMLITMKGNLRSRQINIGMDEAHHLGLGKYLDQNGYRKRGDIMREHLDRVVKLCEKHGYQPMMWSDMFFRVCSKNGGYFEESANLTDEIINSVPEGINLIMWNYWYDEKLYDVMCREHFRFKNKISFAGGGGCWSTIAPFQEYSKSVAKGVVKKIAEYPFDTVFCTEWGDGGAETSFLTTLPTIAIFAEGSWSGDISDEALKLCTKRVSADYDDFKALDRFTLIPEVTNNFSYATRYLLYSDVLQGKWDMQIPDGCEEHFIATEAEMRRASENNPKWSYIFDFYADFARVLAAKSELGKKLKAAYDRGDNEEMLSIADTAIPKLVSDIEIFLKSFKKRWETDSKDFGFDIQEIRIGGLIYRLKGAADKIHNLLEGKLEKIEELEAPRMLIDKNHPAVPYGYTVLWADAASSSII